MALKLIESWIEYHSKEKGNPDLYWAWEELFEMVQKSPELAWEYILEIANYSSNERVLSNLAAGPLEDLLVLHGADFIDRIETITRQNPPFVPVVKGVWQNNMQPSIWERVHAMQSKYS
jgi:hypothetical protein